MQDMTVGQPRQHLWRHALPLLLGNWMQLSYNAVDSIIAGRFIGKEALAAEGIAAPVMNLVILAISGVCIGAGILMSEAFGAKDRDKLCRVLANTVLSGLVVCCIIAGLGMALTPQILHRLEVPQQIHAMTNGLQGFYRGMGKMYTTVIGTFLQSTTRTICAAILAPKFGIVGIAFSCAIGWSLMLLFEVPYYVFTCKKQKL